MMTERKDVICYWHHGTYCEAVGDMTKGIPVPNGARVVATKVDMMFGLPRCDDEILPLDPHEIIMRHPVDSTPTP